VAGVSTPEAPAGASGQGSVVLDIGPHAGALVVYTSPGMLGAELEIRPAGGEWHGAHTAVRERRVNGRVLFAGVFGSLAVGRYELRVLGDHGDAVAGAQVLPGSVVEASFPTPGSGAGGGPPGSG